MEKRYDEYQIPCLACIKEARESGAGAGLVVMAGGLGKTIVAANDVKDFLRTSRKRVLFLCHDTGILEQNAKKFEKVLGYEYSFGFFHGTRKDFHEVDVLFASFQTMESSKNWKQLFRRDEFAYVIVDEAHHAKARTYESATQYFESEFRLGLTATPKRQDGRNLEDVFGKPIFSLDFIEAWDEGYLTGVDYQLITDEMSGLKSFLDSENCVRISLKDLNRRVFTPKRDEWLVADIKERSKVKNNPRTVVFCQSITHANYISELIEGSVALHCDMPKAQQDKNLQDFRDGIVRTIVVVDKFNEGIDVPEIDVLVRLRLTGSATVFQQQLCRGLRVCDGKDNVLVLDYVTTCEQIEQLFALEEELEKPERKKRAGGKKGKLEPKFVMTITGSGWKATKADILNLIKRARKFAYTKDMLIRVLQRLGRKLGRTPTSADVENDKTIPSLMAFYAHFGSFDAALIAAGFTPNTISYTREELMLQLIVFTKANGRPPIRQEVTKNSCFANIETFLREFGRSFDDDVIGALKEALEDDDDGIEWDLEAIKRAEALRLFLEFAKELKRTPTRREVDANKNLPSANGYKSLFGSWAGLLEAANLKKGSVIRVENDTLIVEDKWEFMRQKIIIQLRKKAAELGRTPTTIDIEADRTMVGVKTIRKYFGSLPEAILAANLAPVKIGGARERKPPVPVDIEKRRKMLIERLQDKAKKLKRTPTKREVDEDKSMPSSTTYQNTFGSWNAALKAADLLVNLDKSLYTEEAMLGLLVRLYRELGRTPMGKDIDESDSIFTARSYEKKFGKLSNALVKAGIPLNWNARWNPKK